MIQNQCFGTVLPGGTCEVRIQLVPSTPSALKATLHVQSGNAGAADIPMSGQGHPAGDLTLAPVAGSFEDFAGVRTGSRAVGIFSLSNPSSVSSGPLSFHFNRAEFSLDPPEPGDCLPGTTTLVDGQSCNLRIGFAPSERGPVETTLTSVSPGAGSVSLTLTGRGIIPAVPSTSADTVDFGGIVLGQTAIRSVIFSNQGDDPWVLAGVRLEPLETEGFSIQNSDCAADKMLGSGESCSVRLEFRPRRAGEAMAAGLVASGADGAQNLTVDLQGQGLLSGALTVGPVTPGEDDFGAVLLGDSSERIFAVINPSPQPSGVLELITSEGFEILGPPGAGECASGATSLVNGESCLVRVKFTPTLRAPANGSLTVISPLAAAAGVALSGLGIVPARLDVTSEVNFGRVLTNASANRVVTVRNSGDQGLPQPLVELVGGESTQLSAFSFQSNCGALSVDGRCDISLRFAPAQIVPHASNLRISAQSGAVANVLLLGEALQPGLLQLASTVEGGADFGEVAIGSPVTRSFTLSNTNSVPSGRLSITTDNSRFQPGLGTCADLPPEGLADASCSFDVTFTRTALSTWSPTCWCSRPAPGGRVWRSEPEVVRRHCSWPLATATWGAPTSESRRSRKRATSSRGSSTTTETWRPAT